MFTWTAFPSPSSFEVWLSTLSGNLGLPGFKATKEAQGHPQPRAINVIRDFREAGRGI